MENVKFDSIATAEVPSLYNRSDFPEFIGNHGEWDFWANAAGQCAAIPTLSGALGGRKSSSFGSVEYARRVLGKARA